ncbi:MAG: CcoQ/FixQ family Cbb3-type cytochrome c oxidase assembly chaperone [Gammaproteobacteria bacterium]|nr:CcoQ/FixQ family Cbb3-type cytochrome c oxidase assembly chaperone [Gammaproteobacteria bacterium]
MDTGIIQSIWTIIVMVVFVWVVFWAWNGKRKKSFDKASRIPMEDDEMISSDMHSKENNHD